MKKSAIFLLSSVCAISLLFAQTEKIWMRNRAEFLFDCAKEIQWPSEFNSFNIAVLGTSAINQNIENLIISNRKIQGKPVVVNKYQRIDQIENAQMIYLNMEDGYNINDVLNFIKGKEILIVSENYPFNTSMINMVLVENEFRFDLTEERIKNEGFEISNSIINKSVKDSKNWQILYEQSSFFKKMEKEKIMDQKETIDAQETFIISQSETILNSKIELKKLKEELDKLIKDSELQQSQYNAKATEIEKLDQTLKSRQEEINLKDQLISTQNVTLEDQKRKLNYQRNFTLMLIVIAILALVVIYFIWKSYKEKKASNIILEKKNKEIASTSDELKIVNKELEQFAYLVSHDLQEPLNTITSWLEFVDTSKLDDLGKECMDYIGQSTKRMRELIRGLLEYSQLGSNVDFEVVDCNLLLKNITSNLEKVIKDKKASISYEPLPNVTGHQLKLSMLFQNLISNSLKFTKEGVIPEITISAQKAETEGYWEFCVADNGIGISENGLSKIFDIFYREHSNNEYKGTGIGLAHVKKIVEMHQGKLRVTSKLGKGTSFFFTLQQVA